MYNFLLYAFTISFWPWLKTKEDTDFGVFLRIGSLEIRWYAICILAGAILALLRCRYELKRKGLPADYYDNFFLSVIPISLVGARIWYIISSPDEFDSFLEMLGWVDGKIQISGLAVQGGVLFGVIWGCIYFTKIKKRYPLPLHIDLIVPSIFIGQIFGRWGNFFNGEVFGKMVSRKSLWWIPSFIINNATTGNVSTMGGLAHAGNQFGYDQVNIPLFYVEGVLNLLGFILIGYVLWRFWKKFRKPYDMGCLYFIWYGIVRLILEPYRVSVYIMERPIFGMNVRTSIFMSIVYIILGVAGMILTRIFNKDKNYENMYVNAEEDAREQAAREEKEAEIAKMIEEKKQEIRARKAAEKKENHNE